MAYEYTLDKIINPEEIIRIQEAEKSFNAIATAYGKLAAKMAGGIKINPSDLEAMDKKQKEYIASLKELHSTQSKLSDLQKEYDKLLKSVAEQTRKNVEQILAESKANDLNASAELKAAKAKTETLKQEKLLNQESKKRKISIEEGVAALKMEVKSLRDAEEQNRLLRAAKKDIDLTTKEGRDTMQKFNTVIDKNTELIKKNSDSLVKSKMNVGRYKEDIKSAASEIMKGNISIKNMGDLAKSTGGYLKSEMGAGLSEVRIGVGSMIKGMVGAQAIIGAFHKMIGLFKSGIQSIIDFEAANSKLAAVLGTNSKNVKDLTADAQRLGAATKYTASEATNLQIELAKLGFSRKEILQSTEGILKFAQATGAELPEAAALAGASLRMFGADTKETERYVSAMAVATVKSALSFSYLQTAMPIVGSVAKTYGFEVEDVLALLGRLADAGIDASSAATATRNILLNLANGGGKLSEAMGGNVRTLNDFVSGLKKVKDEGVELAGMLEMTDKRSVNAFANFVAGADSLLVLKKSITGVTGELNGMANTMGDNVQGAIAGLSSAWEALSLTFSKSTGPMKYIINWLAEKIRAIADGMRDIDDRINGVENVSKRLAADTSGTESLKAKTTYNLRRKKLIEAGDSEEIASIKALQELSNQRLEVTEDELKKMNALKKKALDAGNKLKDMESYSFKKFLFGKEDSVDLKKAEDAAISAQNEYMKFVYTISKKEIKNEAIDKFVNDNKKIGSATNTTKEITEKEKKELEKRQREAEKSAKERLRIQQEYQQSEFDLMDEGLEKELAKIALSYNKRIAAVKGNSEEEIKTRENLAKELQSAIEDKTTSYVIAKEQKDISNKLEAVKKGSREELDLRIEQLELQRDIETTEVVKTGEDIALIDAKYNAKRKELNEKFADEQNQVLQKGYAGRSVIARQEMENEISEQAELYTTGIIDKEEFEKRKADITEKYAIQQAQAAIDLAKIQLETADLSPESKLALKQKLAEAEIALAKAVCDAEVKAADDSAKAQKEKLEKIADGLKVVGDFLNAFADLGSAIYERKIQEVEEQQDANDEAGEAEQERIDRLAESGAISTEEAEARKRGAAARTAEKDKELAKKKADLQTKQAKMDKANAISQAVIQTALAVMNALNTKPFPLGLALAITAGAMGAVQLATIIAQPIPKYAKGTDNHPGGLAVVGDGGREEMIISNGKSWITPSVPTLVDIPKGSVVLPDVMNMESIRGMKSDVMLLLNEAERKGNPVTVNVSNDYRKLEVGIDRLNSSFNAMAKYQRKAAVQADLRNISSRL